MKRLAMFLRKCNAVIHAYGITGIFIVSMAAMATYGSVMIAMSMEFHSNVEKHVNLMNDAWEKRTKIIELHVIQQNREFNEIIENQRVIIGLLMKNAKH